MPPPLYQDRAPPKRDSWHRLVNAGIQDDSEIRLRLASWVDMEQRDGWATREAAATG